MTKIALPAPETEGDCALEKTLLQRRSTREFSRRAVPLGAVGQILWAAQGVTAADGGRTAPSAGALYPLELYLLAARVGRLAAGIYKYSPRSHELRLHAGGDRRVKLAEAALSQGFVAEAPAVLVVAAAFARTAARYGSRAARYVHMEAGHAAQNAYLQARPLGLGTVIVGAFEDDAVHEVLQLPKGEAPLALMPIGRLAPST